MKKNVVSGFIILAVIFLISCGSPTTEGSDAPLDLPQSTSNAGQQIQQATGFDMNGSDNFTITIRNTLGAPFYAEKTILNINGTNALIFDKYTFPDGSLTDYKIPCDSAKDTNRVNAGIEFYNATGTLIARSDPSGFEVHCLKGAATAPRIQTVP